MKLLVRACPFCFFASLAACTPLLATPPGFVRLKDDSSTFDYRATTADGLTIAARELEHEPRGELSFWTRALENEMRFRGGYALLGTETLKTDEGICGKLLRFGHDEDGRPHLYYLAVFVTADEIYLVEAGGAKEQMVEKEKLVRQAFKSLKAL